MKELDNLTVNERFILATGLSLITEGINMIEWANENDLINEFDLFKKSIQSFKKSLLENENVKIMYQDVRTSNL
jgi:hypothetical protein